MIRQELLRALRLPGNRHAGEAGDGVERSSGSGAELNARPYANALLKAFWVMRFAGAVMLYALSARIWLFVELSHEPITPFNYDADCCSIIKLMFWAREDVLFACHCALGALAATALAVGIGVARRNQRVPAVVVHILASIPLGIVGFIQATYYKVAFVMHAQLDHALISEAIQSGFGLQELSEYVSLIDLPLVTGPLIFYLLLHARSPVIRAAQALGLCALGGALLQVPNPKLPKATLRKELAVNPAVSVITSIADDWGKAPLLREFDVLPTPADLEALGLSPLESPSPSESAPLGHEAMSVVMMVMESAGRRYAFRREPELVMPNLVALSETSLHLANHLSPANNSTNSLFSLFTGWYPAPTRAVFSSQRDLRIRTFHQYLPWIRDTFLVTPGGLKSYFPRGLLANAGMELRDRRNLGLAQYRSPPGWWVADERDGVDAFLARLSSAKSPVFAVYYSYAAHSPYFDYGAEFRVKPAIGSDLDRYYNNLRLLDTQLASIVSAIRKRPERTLLIVLGDHGEAFNQHPGNIMHSRNSFQENFETFAVINLPGTLEPKVIHERTLHIDIVPTVLSALGVPFSKGEFQGIDVTIPHLNRPYVFLYGNEGTLSSINADGIKLQMSYTHGWCRVVNLIKDPRETRYQRCEADASFTDPADLGQIRHTGMFHAFQPVALRALQSNALDASSN